MKIDKEYVFELYGKILKSNIKEDKKEFVDYYLKYYPNNKFLTEELNKDNLHMMYLHLYR